MPSFRGQVRPTPRQDKSSGSHKAAGLKPTVSKTCGPSKGSGARPKRFPKHPLQTASVLFEYLSTFRMRFV